MTPNQRARLHDIRRDLELWPRHPSPKVQERYRATTPEAVAHAQVGDRVREAPQPDRGQAAIEPRRRKVRVE